MPGNDHPFALCLTHDVDRPFKKAYHALYYALTERDTSHLREFLTGANPYWTFDDICALEADLGVRSAFYILLEPSVRERSAASLMDADTWVQLLTRYDIDQPAIAALLRALDEGGWEVGLHGSLGTSTDPERLRHEKNRIEAVVDQRLLGGRQHYLRLERPETWRHYADSGLVYDASLGSSTDNGFDHGYDIIRPFDDDFVVFPLTVMESTLPDPGASFDRAWQRCESLLTEAEANGAVMSVLWHPRLFSETDFPGYRQLYRRLIAEATDRGAWVGSPGQYYDQFLASSG